MALEKQINQDFLLALKGGDAVMLGTLRLLRSAFQNRKIEKMIKKEAEMPDEEVVTVLKSEVKKRKEAILAYEQGHRADLAAKESQELLILEKYLPQQLTEEAVRAIVVEAAKEISATSSADFGKLMGVAMKKVAGQADGQVVSRLVKEVLQ